MKNFIRDLTKKCKSKKYQIAIFFAVVALFAMSNFGEILVSPYVEKAEAAWYNPGWSCRKKITIDHTKVPNTNQANFPVLINTTDLEWRDTINGGDVGQADGGDILFTKSDGSSKLDYEIEKYDNTTGELIAWVEVDSLSPGVDTEIYIYYGNAACADQWNVNGTWDSDYEMVQHLDEIGGVHSDSTSNGNNGTPSTNGITQNTGGQINGADGFDGYTGSVSVSDSGSLDIAGAVTVEGWVMKNPGIPITNCTELQNVKNDLFAHYYLANDIDCSATIGWNGGKGFEPLGIFPVSFFEGAFDGRGYKISNLYINRPTKDNVGLFGSASYNMPGFSRIKNVILENVDITGKRHVGGIAGSIFRTKIANCSVSGSIQGDLVTNTQIRVGGIVGYSNPGEISYCHFDGDLAGYSLVGGIVGDNNATATTIVSNCHSEGNIDCHSSHCGGLTGDNFREITNSYSTSSDNSTCGGSYCGGFLGINGGGTIIGSYWDTQTSGRNNMCGKEIMGGTGCNDTHGKTTAEMKQQATFVGWDFANIWTINEGVDYPTLRWQEWDNSLVGKERGAYALQISEDGSELHGYINDNQISASISSPTGWHYYVLTYDGTNQKLFIDGNLESTTALAGAITLNNDEVKIGGGSLGEFDEHLFGSMDEVRISSVARSNDWIATNYNNQKYPDKATHGAAGFYSISGDSTPPVFVTEAWIPDDGGNEITNGGTVNLNNIDEAGEYLTIYSNASDASGLYNHKVKRQVGAGPVITLIDCYDADTDGYCDLMGDIRIADLKSDSTGDIAQLQIGPFSDGDVISYWSEATDTVLPVGNTGFGVVRSFSVATLPNTPPTVTPSLPTVPTDWCNSSPGVTMLSWIFNDAEDGAGNQTAYRIDLRRSDGGTCSSGKQVDTITSTKVSNIPGCAGFVKYGGHTYEWDITVWDSADASDSAVDPVTTSFVITPLHQYPTVCMTYLPADPVQFDVVTFDPSCSIIYDGNVVNNLTDLAWDWDYKDENPGEPSVDVNFPVPDVYPLFPPGPVPPKVSHSFVEERPYEVDLRVTDATGYFCWASDQDAEKLVGILENMPEWNETTP